MEPLIKIRGFKKSFKKKDMINTIVNNISFDIYKGQCLAIVGESGSGKSSTVRLITGLMELDEGKILYNNKQLSNKGKDRLKEIQGKIQMVFQMPFESFNPRIKIGNSVKEAMPLDLSISEKDKKLQELFCECGLSLDIAEKYPHQVSGGQCQRAAIARALALNPEVLICDEATSALDVTVQQQIIKLLKDIQHNRKMTIIFICHDLALVQEFSDYILVMNKGEIVEQGNAKDIIFTPKSVYTKELIDAAFSLEYDFI